MKTKRLLVILGLTLYWGATLSAQKTITTDVLIVGGGTGGTAAGIQCARLGVKTLIVESTTWLGGMISGAGVSATDGNHKLPSGFWAEFRNKLYAVYGGPKAVETGWVSNTQFEPHVADSIFKQMAAAEKQLTILYNHHFQSLVRRGQKIISVTVLDKATQKPVIILPKLVIDATELGDVMAAAKVPYSLGMEAGSLTGEKVGVSQTNNVVQDLTYVAVLKDYGRNADCTIVKPSNYDPKEFDAACTDYYIDKTRKAPGVDGKKMLEYGKLPNNKYMLNWPLYGNDIYLNIVELDEASRNKELEKAKEQTKRFIYFIQNELGYKNLGLADDEFPTEDRLALMPYHREGRRVEGLVRFNMRHISEPYTYGDPLYRTGIAVGDYPIDHHHKKNLAAPQHLEFYPVPSFNVPLGALIPQQVENLIIAEKGISVSNVVNGTTRLQPCVLLIGQAAGALAGLSIKQSLIPKKVPVRLVQKYLLDAKAFIMPYIDVKPDAPYFEAVQKIGATGILKGHGIPYKWANQTWFYPDSLVNGQSLAADLQSFKKYNYKIPTGNLRIQEAIDIVHQLDIALAGSVKGSKIKSLSKQKSTLTQLVETSWQSWGLDHYTPGRFITRKELAVLLNNTIDPFERLQIGYNGYAK
ncbi:FAD-dependent oxidoreductase [Flavisolibacter tropicus]|uniref:FAD-dependent oxidoreductase n=1 Tax=Flavisolibacter tropicus TaxID=1492898 RepID=A0A172TT81_9BACT|nr:FAD-dependent oxidoreductase [Flavisolibacter tropicus]ANE49993.1 hypothetical protein SY85_05275 [Flavisolibacter tropicus]